ncbi:hypothetical protein [Paenibacillus sp. DCT19]|uniref:hypothetical protein n=1 Tax=Paenibacillus sp. DCT19 TaxID=2211212 RepID=UPI0020C1D876|nr:hypothetical protein [Paenibacillus sp. DCT19]
MPISFSNWMQQTNLMFSSGEQLDLMPSIYNYSQSVLQGQLIPLVELLASHGQGIVKALDPAYLDASKVKGIIYGVPTLHEMAMINGVSMRKDIVQKYDVDTSKMQTIQDREEVLKTVKAGEPNMASLIPSTVGASILNNYKTFDELSNTIGVLPNYDNNLKVVNLYDTKEYAERGFSFLTSAHPAALIETARSNGMEMKVYKFT